MQKTKFCIFWGVTERKEYLYSFCWYFFFSNETLLKFFIIILFLRIITLFFLKEKHENKDFFKTSRSFRNILYGTVFLKPMEKKNIFRVVGRYRNPNDNPSDPQNHSLFIKVECGHIAETHFSKTNINSNVIRLGATNIQPNEEDKNSSTELIHKGFENNLCPPSLLCILNNPNCKGKVFVESNYSSCPKDPNLFKIKQNYFAEKNKVLLQFKGEKKYNGATCPKERQGVVFEENNRIVTPQEINKMQLDYSAQKFYDRHKMDYDARLVKKAEYQRIKMLEKNKNSPQSNPNSNKNPVLADPTSITTNDNNCFSSSPNKNSSDELV